MNQTELPDGYVPRWVGLMSDAEILRRLELPEDSDHALRISQFEREQRRTEVSTGAPCASYGLSSYGYDVRLGCAFRRMVECHEPISPYAPAEKVWGPMAVAGWGAPVVIPPGDVLLGETVETVRVPRDALALVLCKSTWARVFLNLNTTPLEPGWRGTVTLELANMSRRHLLVYPGHGIGQLVFFSGERCLRAYDERGGVYQDQSGPTPSMVGRRFDGTGTADKKV